MDGKEIYITEAPEKYSIVNRTNNEGTEKIAPPVITKLIHKIKLNSIYALNHAQKITNERKFTPLDRMLHIFKCPTFFFFLNCPE